MNDGYVKSVSQSIVQKGIHESLQKEYFHKQDELSLMFDKMSSKSFSENTSYRIDISRFLSRTSVFKK